MDRVDYDYLLVIAVRTISDGLRLIEWIENEDDANTLSIRNALSEYQNRIASDPRMIQMELDNIGEDIGQIIPGSEKRKELIQLLNSFHKP